MERQESRGRGSCLCLLSPSFYWHASRPLVLNNSAVVGSPSGPHRHKHTTDWTNHTLPQRIFSSAAWTGVIGHNCHRRLKGWTTMGTLCEDFIQFTSASPGLLTLFCFQFNEEANKPQIVLPLKSTEKHTNSAFLKQEETRFPSHLHHTVFRYHSFYYYTLRG